MMSDLGPVLKMLPVTLPVPSSLVPVSWRSSSVRLVNTLSRDMGPDSLLPLTGELARSKKPVGLKISPNKLFRLVSVFSSTVDFFSLMGTFSSLGEPCMVREKKKRELKK
jgi:hypothetical protein